MADQILNSLLKDYEKKKSNAELEAENRKISLYEKFPKLKEIEDELNSFAINITKNILNNGSSIEKQEELKRKIAILKQEKKDILKSLNISSDYLKPQYECSLCNDTGYITDANYKTTMCSCLKQRLYDIAYNKSNMGNLDRENFSTFNIRYFSDKPDKERFKSEISPRENMNLLREKANNFIENFDDPTEKNLIFTGGTGLGKTFLSNCIAAEILKQGKTVLYQTAPVMLDSILDEKFGKNETGFNLIENILNTNLLIIDDLGTEKISETKITELFTIINTRLLNQNHSITKTIISTNLTVNELFNIYTTRIGSRLAGSYRFLRFFGDDIRLKKGKKEI